METQRIHGDMATNATPTARTATERKRDQRERKRTGGMASLAAWAGHSASLPAAKKSKPDATAGWRGRQRRQAPRRWRGIERHAQEAQKDRQRQDAGRQQQEGRRGAQGNG